MEESGSRDSPRICVLVPSRGLIHSRTEESIHVAMYSHQPYDREYSHDLGVREARKYLTERFLATQADYALWVDEDIVLTPNIVGELLDLNVDAGMAHYIWKHEYVWQGPGVFPDNMRLPKDNFSGFGCALVRRRVHERLGPQGFDGFEPGGGYGGEDVSFWQNFLRHPDLTWAAVDTFLPHLKLVEYRDLAVEQRSIGAHGVEAWFPPPTIGEKTCGKKIS